MAQHLFTPTDQVHHRQSGFKTLLNGMFTELYDAWASMLAAIGGNTSDIGGLTTSVSTLNGAYSPLVKHTDVGGLAVKMINKTGGASVKGYLVTPSASTNHAVELTAVDIPNCVGCFLDSGVADGQLAWVVIQGLADVYFSGSTVRGHMARIGVAADTGEQAGQAISEAVPTAPFATDKHFGEIGHVAETRTGAGLARVVLHFN